MQSDIWPGKLNARITNTTKRACIFFRGYLHEKHPQIDNDSESSSSWLLYTGRRFYTFLGIKYYIFLGIKAHVDYTRNEHWKAPTW